MINKLIILSLFFTSGGFAAGDILQEWFDAAQKGDLDVIQRLNGKVNINAQTKGGNSALSYAADFGHENVVKFLLNEPGIKVNIENQHGATALLFAVDSEHENIVKLFLQAHGIDINAQDKRGNTALMAAAKNGDENISKLLLDAGANPDIKNKERKTALDLADAAFKPRFETLINRYRLREQWFKVVEEGHIDRVKKLSEQIDINAQNKYGWTALIYAALKGHEDIVKFLLRIPSIKINIQNDEGETALMTASAWGHENIVKLLLGVADININAQDRYGNTALMFAVTNDRENITKFLLAAGANPDIKNNKNQTALDLAKPKFKPTFMALISEPVNQTRLFSGLTTELHNLSKVLLSAH